MRCIDSDIPSSCTTSYCGRSLVHVCCSNTVLAIDCLTEASACVANPIVGPFFPSLLLPKYNLIPSSRRRGYRRQGQIIEYRDCRLERAMYSSDSSQQLVARRGGRREYVLETIGTRALDSTQTDI